MNRIVSREEWLKERKQLLRDEKAFTRLKDAMAARRREMPWVAIEKDYRFETNSGEQSLLELFGDYSQLIVYHFMYGPEAKDGCLGCSEIADSFNSTLWYLNTRDANLVAVSRGPLETLQAYRTRMEWDFEWVSSENSVFNYDFNVSYDNNDPAPKQYNFRTVTQEMGETHGVSIFIKNDDNQIYHTYTCHERGTDILCSNMQYLDLLPKGRQDDRYWSNPTRRK